MIKPYRILTKKFYLPTSFKYKYSLYKGGNLNARYVYYQTYGYEKGHRFGVQQTWDEYEYDRVGTFQFYADYPNKEQSNPEFVNLITAPSYNVTYEGNMIYRIYSPDPKTETVIIED